MTWRGSTTVPDRIFAALPYLLPLIDALPFGEFLFSQFPILQLLFIPLFPVLQIYTLPLVGPFVGLIVFFALFFLVVRNERINHFIRFNAMQAILIDIVLILCRLVLSIFPQGGPGSLLIETLYNVVFLGVLAAFIYSVAQSLLGRYAEIPTISDAVYMQVR
uniref:Tic20 family protein n=1 Tax=Trichocoleus desertorum TaxID=1481672 RepID=UPI0025B2CB7D|nr:Tic20 family protein [Trichocoleus desertorum]